MPLVKIEIREGKSSDYQRAILDGVHQALVQVLGLFLQNFIEKIIYVPEIPFFFETSRTKISNIYVGNTLRPYDSFITSANPTYIALNPTNIPS